jgi:hypothetical protein
MAIATSGLNSPVTDSARSEPQRGQDGVELPAQINLVGVDIDEPVELGGLWEPLRVGPPPGPHVLASDELAVGALASDHRPHAGAGHALEDPVFLEAVVPLVQPACVQPAGSGIVDFVVGDEDAAAVAAVLSIEETRGVEGRARPGEEVDDERIAPVADHRVEAVPYGVDRLWKREQACLAEIGGEQVRPVPAGVVAPLPPHRLQTLRLSSGAPVVEDPSLPAAGAVASNDDLAP